jgi:hypothetical protein
MATAAQLEPLQQQSQQQWQRQQHQQQPSDTYTAPVSSTPQLGESMRSGMLTNPDMEEHGSADGSRRSWQYQANGTLQAYMTQLGSDIEAKEATEEVTPDITHGVADPVYQETLAPQQSDDGDDDYSLSDHAAPEATAAATTLEPHAEQDGQDDDYSVSDEPQSSAALTREPPAEQANTLDVTATNSLGRVSSGPEDELDEEEVF